MKFETLKAWLIEWNRKHNIENCVGVRRRLENFTILLYN